MHTLQRRFWDVENVRENGKGEATRDEVDIKIHETNQIELHNIFSYG